MPGTIGDRRLIFGHKTDGYLEGFLTYYYEYHFLYITGIEHVESKSIQGASLMKLQFHPGTDMAGAMSETVAYVNRARTIVVNLKPDRLKALGMSPDEIVQANTISLSGNMNLGDRSPIVPVNAVVKNIKDLEAVPLRVGSAGAVFKLSDAAGILAESRIGGCLQARRPPPVPGSGQGSLGL